MQQLSDQDLLQKGVQEPRLGAEAREVLLERVEKAEGMFQKKDQADLPQGERRLLAEVKVEGAGCEEEEGPAKERGRVRGACSKTRERKKLILFYTLYYWKIACLRQSVLQALV